MPGGVFVTHPGGLVLRESRAGAGTVPGTKPVLQLLCDALKHRAVETGQLEHVLHFQLFYILAKPCRSC